MKTKKKSKEKTTMLPQAKKERNRHKNTDSYWLFPHSIGDIYTIVVYRCFFRLRYNRETRWQDWIIP